MATLPVQTQIDSLAARVSALDGQGLHAPAKGFVQQTAARISGLKTDLVQSVLTLDSQLQDMHSEVSGLWRSFSTYLGISPPPTSLGTLVPPAGGAGTLPNSIEIFDSATGLPLALQVLNGVIRVVQMQGLYFTASDAANSFCLQILDGSLVYPEITFGDYPTTILLNDSELPNTTYMLRVVDGDLEFPETTYDASAPTAFFFFEVATGFIYGLQVINGSLQYPLA
jgi:hypothetical protein